MIIQAVLFDLDNTLTHRDLTTQAYSRYLAEYYASALAQVELEKLLRLCDAQTMAVIRKGIADSWQYWRFSCICIVAGIVLADTTRSKMNWRSSGSVSLDVSL